MKEPPSPLDIILEDIRKALDAGLFYAALCVTLSLPDVCSALEKPEGHERFKDVSKRYIDWCRRYIEPKFRRLIAEDCWALRGGVIHNGMLANHPKMKERYDRIIFTPPNPQNVRILEGLSKDNGGIIETAMMIDLVWFCENFMAATREWYQQKKNDPIVAKSLPDLVRLRPLGIRPHIVGLPVIA